MGERLSDRPVVAITMGDPGGIGPEVTVAALADGAVRERARYVVLGSSSAMFAAAEVLGIEPMWWRMDADADLFDATLAHDVVLIDYDERVRKSLGGEEPEYPARATRLGGELSFRLVEDAIERAKLPTGDRGRVDAIVTGPISKEAWALAGRGRYPGHTELLATRFGVRRHGMMFVGPRLRVILATAHLPLMEVRDALTIGRIVDAIDLGAEACRGLGILEPRVAVCGLNPHAGEAGLLGDEETRLIEPAIEHARRGGVDARGPFPADTVFNAAVAGKFDLVVAMYHDQGLIPVKLLARDESVNVTVGLPTVRTSPDHGTAYDIARKGLAEAGSMKSAINLAVDMVQAGRRRG